MANKQQRRKARHERRLQSRNDRNRGLIASGEVANSFFAESEEPVVLESAGSGEDSNGPKRFKMMAYAGGKMMPRGFGFPVVVELMGMSVLGGQRPIHFAHDQNRPVGHAESVEIKRSVRATGVLSVDNEDSQMIASSAANGFPWRSSVGITYPRIDFIEEGQTLKANGRTFRGPVYYVPKSTLYEISFVTVAGDNSSNAKIAATRATQSKETIMNPFDKWLEASGFNREVLSETQLKALQSSFDAQQTPTTPDPPTTPDTTLAAEGGSTQVLAAEQEILAGRQLHAAESRRVAGIRRICANYQNPDITVDEVQLNLEAHGIEQGWTVENVELHALRAGRATAPAMHTTSSTDLNANVLEAAARLSLGQDGDGLVAEYGEEVVGLADNYRNIGLRELAAFACQIEGVSIPAVWGTGRQTLQAAFTTQTLPSVLENVLNKTLLPIYEAMDTVAKKLCSIGRTNDFKQVSNVQLLGSGAWEKVGADGELKHGQVSDNKFTNQPETYGQFMMLNHQTWKNDDLGALEKMATYMAIMGSQVVEDTFFEVLLANANNFIHANNNNLATNGAFGAKNLSLLKTLFRKQKSGPGSRAKNKRPINIRPVKLLTSVELEDDAASLIGSANLMVDDRDTTATAGSKAAPKNPHHGRYEVLSAPQVSDTLYTGNTSTGFWLFADPRVLAAFELLFVDGIQTPIIERVNPAPNVLGLGFRGYINFGCAQQDPKGVAKENG